MQVPPSTTLQYISMYIMKSGLLLYKCIPQQALQDNGNSFISNSKRH